MTVNYKGNFIIIQYEAGDDGKEYNVIPSDQFK